MRCGCPGFFPAFVILFSMGVLTFSDFLECPDFLSCGCPDFLLPDFLCRNELATMEVALAYYDAQLEYAQQDRNGNGFAEPTVTCWLTICGQDLSW